jgi:hypothetical protein
MSGRPSRRAPRQPRRMRPALEGLDSRELLSGGAVGHSLGTFFVPGTSVPRVSTPTVIVNAHAALSSFLTAELGSGLQVVVRQAEELNASSNNVVASAVLSQPLVHAVLSRQDTYALLGSAVGAAGGNVSTAYTTTAGIVASALQTGTSRPAPNAPRAVPGLRLASALVHNNNLSSTRSQSFLRAFHVAVERGVFSLSSLQNNLVGQGFAQFVTQVNTLNQAGAFQPSVPPAAPTLPVGPLGGTLEVSLGALRNLADVGSPLTGLPLPVIGNFPGRIDVGFVFDRAGNYGIILTARGPLSGAPKGVASADTVGGDVRVSVSNASSLSALNGQHLVEGLTQGSALLGDLQASTYSNGVSTFSASAGYGTGLEFGTGTAYTQVIPLGNVYAIIPEFPK